MRQPPGRKVMVTFDEIKKDAAIQTYIKGADEFLENNILVGYQFSDHGMRHVLKVAMDAADILRQLGYSEREQELAKIAGYLHDIGNMVNRAEHSQSGSMMAFYLLSEKKMDPQEIVWIMAAIGNHDDEFGVPANPVAAAVLLADKSDIGRERLRCGRRPGAEDSYYNNEYAVTDHQLIVDREERKLIQTVRIDCKYCSVLTWLKMLETKEQRCADAARQLECEYILSINGMRMN